MVSVMAKNIYSNGEENGEVGRELAIINGLKGNMYQTLMLNQQLEKKLDIQLILILIAIPYNMQVKIENVI
jgi:hypothetical protein